jgi:hypothetical protein
MQAVVSLFIISTSIDRLRDVEELYGAGYYNCLAAGGIVCGMGRLISRAATRRNHSSSSEPCCARLEIFFGICSSRYSFGNS